MTEMDLAYRRELVEAMLDCEANGDVEGAEIYQSMIDTLDEMETK